MPRMFENVTPKDLNSSPAGQPPMPAFPTAEQPTPPPSDPFSRSVPQAPKPKIKTTGKLSSVGWVIIILVIIGVIGVGGVFAYNYFINTPDRIFDTAIDNLETLRSGTISYDVSITGNRKDADAASLIPSERQTFTAGLETKFSKTEAEF